MTTTSEAPANVEARGGILRDLTSPETDVRWYPDQPATVEAARDAFARAMGTGALAYRADTPDGGGEQVTEFDPDARALIVTRPLQGG